jgi:hypothetical protein
MDRQRTKPNNLVISASSDQGAADHTEVDLNTMFVSSVPYLGLGSEENCSEVDLISAFQALCPSCDFLGHP